MNKPELGVSIIVAENESLDLGSSYAKRWDAVFASVQKGDPCEKVAAKVSKALYGGMRKALKQFREYGVRLSDLLDARNSPQRRRQFVRQTEGHPYAQQFESAASASGPAVEECLRGWVEAILDKAFDQIKLRVADTNSSRNFFDLNQFIDKVREMIDGDVERIAANLAKNPDWQPRRRPGQAKADDAANLTEELMGVSLLGGKK